MSDPAIEPPEGVIADLQNPTDVLRTINFVTQALTIAFCSLFVFTRALQKLRLPTWYLSIDDYLTVISWILMIGYCICGVFLSLNGGGYHMWEVSSEEVVRYLKAGYAATIFYAPMTLCIKLSLLSLIARVFSPYQRMIRCIYILGGLLVIYYVISLILKIRICLPISAYWNMQMDKCLDQSAIILGDSIISTATDAIILVLPLPLTWSLQIPRNKKLRVAGMLAVGGLATAFSAWRLHLIITDGASPDATILFVQVVLSGNAEAGIALICTCLPAFVGQFKLMESHVRYGSSRTREAGLRDNTSTPADNLGHGNPSRCGTTWRAWQDNCRNSLDEVELISPAQEESKQGRATEHSGGILCKVEVTHTISHATESFDKHSKA